MQSATPGLSNPPLWSRYLGLTWSPEFDCWGLVRRVYAEELGVDLPYTGIAPESVFKSLRLIASHPIRQQFCKSDPEHLAVAEFRHGHGDMPHHIGIYIETPDGPKVLHLPKGGVVLDRPQDLSNITYWVYCG